MKKNANIGTRGAIGLWIASVAAALALVLAITGGAIADGTPGDDSNPFIGEEVAAGTPGGDSIPQDCQSLCDNFKAKCCGQNADPELCSNLAQQWDEDGPKEGCWLENGQKSLTNTACGEYDCMNIKPKPKKVKQRSECKIKCGTSTEVTVAGACCYTGVIISPGGPKIFNPNAEAACVSAKDNLEKLTGQTCTIQPGSVCKDDNKCGAGIPRP